MYQNISVMADIFDFSIGLAENHLLNILKWSQF